MSLKVNETKRIEKLLSKHPRVGEISDDLCKIIQDLTTLRQKRSVLNKRLEKLQNVQSALNKKIEDLENAQSLLLKYTNK